MEEKPPYRRAGDRTDRERFALELRRTSLLESLAFLTERVRELSLDELAERADGLAAALRDFTRRINPPADSVGR